MGGNNDFVMRASMPALFMLYVLCYQYILKDIDMCKKKNDDLKETNKAAKKNGISMRCFALIVCLLIGAVTPCVEFARGIEQVYLRGIDDFETDYVITYNRESLYDAEGWPPINFICTDLENAYFYKHFARI